jgi:hypothetical protein
VKEDCTDIFIEGKLEKIVVISVVFFSFPIALLLISVADPGCLSRIRNTELTINLSIFDPKKFS